MAELTEEQKVELLRERDKFLFTKLMDIMSRDEVIKFIEGEAIQKKYRVNFEVVKSPGKLRFLVKSKEKVIGELVQEVPR